MADLVRGRARRRNTVWQGHRVELPRSASGRPPVDWSKEIRDKLRHADDAAAASRYRRAESAASAAVAAATTPRSGALAQSRQRQEKVEAALRDQERTSRLIRQTQQYRDVQRRLLLDGEQEFDCTRSDPARHKAQTARRSGQQATNCRLKPPRRTASPDHQAPFAQNSWARSELHTRVSPNGCVRDNSGLVSEQEGGQWPAVHDQNVAADVHKDRDPDQAKEQELEQKQERMPIDAELWYRSVTTALAFRAFRLGVA